MLRLQFRFQHTCPVSRLSLVFPKAVFSEWRNNRVHYISIRHCDPNDVARVRRKLRQIISSDKGYMAGDRLLPERGRASTPVLVLRCMGRENSITEIFDRNTAVPLFPIVYRTGWEYYRTLVLDHERVSRLIQEFRARGRVEVTRKTSVRTDQDADSIAIELDELTSSLTDLQVGAVVRAVAGGYFDLPRKASLREIAVGAGVTRRTFGEHLQKAEGKLLARLTPYLALVGNPDPTSVPGSS
jgi:predicted DNA binding protein